MAFDVTGVVASLGNTQTKELTMKARSMVGMVAVAGVAFTAGMYWSNGSTAMAQEGQEIPAEMAEMMQAYEAAGAPGKHHKVLDALTGEWEGTFKMWMAPDTDPMTSSGTVTREWVLNGRFLKETVNAASAMGEFNGLGYMGFNNLDGRYEFVWMEDMSTAITFGTGSFNPDEKKFRFSMEYRDPASGRLVVGWNTLDASSSGNHVYTGYQLDENGRKFKSFEGTVTRK